MFIVGSDDGVYRSSVPGNSDESDTVRVLESGRTFRIRQFDALDGVFAATKTGLYYSPDGEVWADLEVPREAVYAVDVTPEGDRIYAGTRPAHLYVAELESADRLAVASVEWREVEAFRALPSSGEWGVPRNDNVAPVRDIRAHSGAPERLVATVEQGGLFASTDGGETWEERRTGVHDDIHELRLVDSERLVAATGYGLYLTDDAGRTWDRLDADVPQRYFRSAYATADSVYASGALANSSTWNDPDADPGLFRYDFDGTLEREQLPVTAGMGTGFTAKRDTPVVATHRGTILVRRVDGWKTAGTFPVTDTLTGRYTPLTWYTR